MSEQSDRTTIARIDPAKVEPIPVRFWWLKRILIVSGIAFAGLVALRVWWGWEAHRRLQAEIDMYIAAGEPIYPEDFDQEPVPDSDNAAKMLGDAVAAFSLTGEQDQLIDTILDDFSLVHEHLDELRALVEANSRALGLIHAARDAPGLDWGMRIRSPALSFLLPNLSAHRRCAKVLSVITGYYDAIGDSESAVDTLRDAFAYADAVGCQPTLISHLVAIACGRMHARSIERLAPNLRVDRAERGNDKTVRPASRSSVETLISDLLNKDTIEDGFVRSMWSERMAQLDMVTNVWLFVAGTPPPPWLAVATYPLKPILGLDALHGLRKTTAIASVVGEPYKEASPALVDVPPPGSPLEAVVHPLSNALLPSLGRSFLAAYCDSATRQMAGMALAIRLYEIDRGHRPEQLTDLIPDYLRELPVDPFGDGRATFIYRPDADPPILYSIGANGVDDGGMSLGSGNGCQCYREEGDSLFSLNETRPEPVEAADYRASGSSQTLDGDQNEEGAERQGDEDQPGEDQP
ncbi:MAG: hypothetical protein ACYTFA_02955 [Planctomycetota bacterium]|jgi:hypothetical protein